MGCCSTYTRMISPLGNGRSVIQCGITITPDYTTNYTDGDSVGGLLTFTNALCGNNSRLVQVQLQEQASSSVIKYAMDLLLLSTGDYSVSDNSPVVASSISMITGNYPQAVVPFTTGNYYTMGNGTTDAMATKTEADLGHGGLRIVQPGFHSTSGLQQNAYGYLVWKGGANKYANSSARLFLRCTFEID